MVAVDTNILLRFILDDDPVQSPLARKLILEHSIFVPQTVVLEFDWALRRVCKLSRTHANQAIVAIASIETVIVECADRLDVAMALADDGADFADALHLSAAKHCEWMASFDKTFLSTSSGSIPPVRHP